LFQEETLTSRGICFRWVHFSDIAAHLL
jgi:hypothetical protein